MVFRVYVEKQSGFDVPAQQLNHELRTVLGLTGLTSLRLINRYDVEGIAYALFEQSIPTVFIEPQSYTVSTELPDAGNALTFAVEYLPGQFDQRAESASECIQLMSQGERPTVRTATVYMVEGELSAQDIDAIKHYVINPVEAREASLADKDTLVMEMATPSAVEVIYGFNELDE
ncbi:MAG: phosphoribosylformylglycinamidine synthase, partial [Bifidobacterium crudilactis]|nr:phosphoribosylformylglycinamidine synthase [Bifidobacterium crudilactis]